MADRKLNLIAKGAVLSFFGMFFSKLFTYIYRAVVARFVGPEAYGQLSQGLMVVGIMGTLSLLAMHQAMKKYISEYNAKDDMASIKGAYLSGLHVTVPVAVFSTAVLFLSADFVSAALFKSAEVASVIKILAFVPPFMVFSRMNISTMVAHKNLKYRIITNQFFQNIVQVLVTVGLVYLGYGVLGAAMGWLIGVILSSFLAFYFMEYKIGPIVFTEESPNLQRRKLLKFSYPLVMSGMIGTVLGWSDTAFLGYFMTDASVGIYNAALPTAMLIMIPYQAFKSLALPLMSEEEAEQGDLGSMLKTLTRWTFYLSFPAFILMFLFSDQVLHILFGKEYTAASTALIILAVGNIFGAAVGHLDEVLKSIEHTKILFKNTVANLFLNLGLNLILIPDMFLGLGIVGAAIATTGSTVFVNGLMVLEVYYFKRQHPFTRDTWKPIAASVPGLLTVYFGLNAIWNTVPLWSLIPGAFVFGTMFLVTLVLLNGFKEEDRDIIVGIGRRMNQEEKADKLADLMIR